MDKFLKRTPKRVFPRSPQEEDDNSTKKQCSDHVELNLEDLPSDPGLRKKLSLYSCNERDNIRRYYLQKGPCQTQAYKFPQTYFGDIPRRFNPAWFKKYQNWLEYSISRDAAYCLCCYLFKPDFGKQSGGDAFVLEGFKSWNKATERLRDHVGRHDSIHNKALKQCEDLMNQQQSIQSFLQRQSDQVQIDYRTRLGASLDCIRYLLRQGLTFRGHDESESSMNQGASCKRRDHLRESQAKHVVEALGSGELKSGCGLNQERGLQRPADTRWNSHYDTLISLVIQFSSIIEVLEYIAEDGAQSDQRAEANVLLGLVESFDFIFNLHLMKTILGITDELSKALQRKDQDIVNAMKLVKVAKKRLQDTRAKKWETLLAEVCSFCETHDISVLKMDDMFVFPGRSARKSKKVANYHHYKVEVFCSVLDRQLQELDNRFTEAGTKMLSFVACLSPENSFSTFHHENLINLARFYPSDFSGFDLMALDNQLDNYIYDMRSSVEFQNIKGIGALAQKLVENKKHGVYPQVYLLLKLALILPVATASVERVFSAMKTVKNCLRNRMGDRLMNNCLVTFIEKDVFDGITNEMIMQRF